MLNQFNKYRNNQGYIDLNQANVKPVDKKVFGSRKKFWLDIDGTLALFKANMKQNEDIKEIINEEISDYLNINCIKSDLATINEYTGIITLPFKEEQDLFLSVLLLSFQAKTIGTSNDILSVYKALVENNANKSELADIMNDYFSNQVQDIFTLQFDRNYHNSGIIVTNQNYMMAPRFDSSNSFLRIFDDYKINMFFNRRDKEQWIIKQKLNKTKLKITKEPVETSSMNEYLTYRYLKNDTLPQIMQQALKDSDETIKKILLLDLNEILKKLRYYHILVNNNYQRLFKYVLDYSKNEYEKELRRIKNI